MKDSEHIEDFLDFIREAVRRYNMAVSDETLADAQTQDILHQLELEENSYHEIARLGKLLKDVRARRRIAKDDKERLSLIAEWEEYNKAEIKSIERLLGGVRKMEQKQKNRIYAPRTDVLEKGTEVGA